MSDIAVARALSSELSWRMLNLLIDGESTETRMRRKLGVPSRQVKQHLEELVRARLISVRETMQSSGRVSRSYSVTPDQKSASFPPRDYQHLSEYLITGLAASLGEEGAKVLLRDVGFTMGENFGRALLLAVSEASIDPKCFADVFVGQFLKEMGTHPRLLRMNQQSIEYEQFNCPFQELACKYPGTICDILDASIYAGLDKKIGTTTKRLSAKAHGAKSCRFITSWSDPVQGLKGSALATRSVH